MTETIILCILNFVCVIFNLMLVYFCKNRVRFFNCFVSGMNFMAFLYLLLKIISNK